MAAVRSSSRVSIAWESAPAYEDTDTLVLTIHDYSLDLRVFTSGPQIGQIDWSTVAKVSELEGSTTENPILKWDHIIDSRPPSGVDDQGSFATLENGDVTETGRMFNPKTGKIEAYVETWRRRLSSPGTPYCVLESVETDGRVGFIGRVGRDTLACGMSPEGYTAWREEDEIEIWAFGDGKDSFLPRLPRAIPPDWRVGQRCMLGDTPYIVRLLGTT